MFLLAIVVYSCTKDEEFVESVDKAAEVTTRLDKRVVGEITILGSPRNNPFSLTNINGANAQLYGPQATPKEKTHTYVRFEPQTYDDLAILEDWETDSEVPFFDTPFEYEIVQQGQAYHDPAVSDPVLTYQYSSVPVGISLPNIPYTEMEDLYFDRSDLSLLVQSFYLTNNASIINQDLFNGGLTQNEMNATFGTDGVGIGYPPWIGPPPAEGCDGDGYVWTLVQVIDDDPGTSPWGWVCSYVGLPPVYDNPNACGCLTLATATRPAGCVQVEENGNPEPVEIVQINLRDIWGLTETTHTDVNGCWEAENLYSGSVGIKFKFKNENVKVRDTNKNYGTTVIVDQTAGFDSPPYNNHYMFYGNDVVDVESTARRYWAAAHALNFVNAYRADAAADNIQLPREDLNWLNHPGERDTGAAPMLQWNFYEAWAEFLAAAILPVAPIPTALTLGLRPDIWVNYGTRENNAGANVALTFARIEDTAIHELGHASHYELPSVGENFWDQYRTHIIFNGGWGDFGEFSAIGSFPERVALGEAVALYVEDRYFLGPNVNDNNWRRDIATGDLLDGFVPLGMLNDLEDSINDPIDDPHVGIIVVPDNVEGFTPEMYFNALNSPFVSSVREFRNNLADLHLNDTPNNINDFNTITDIYDVFN